MQDLNHNIDAQPAVRKAYRTDRQEQRRRREEGAPKRTVTLDDATDMGRLADVLSQDEIKALIKAEQRMQQIRVRNRLSGDIPDAFWDAYEKASELRHTALRRMVNHYAYEPAEDNA